MTAASAPTPPPKQSLHTPFLNPKFLAIHCAGGIQPHAEDCGGGCQLCRVGAQVRSVRETRFTPHGEPAGVFGRPSRTCQCVQGLVQLPCSLRQASERRAHLPSACPMFDHMLAAQRLQAGCMYLDACHQVQVARAASKMCSSR